jgi:hypothetical protein
MAGVHGDGLRLRERGFAFSDCFLSLADPRSGATGAAASATPPAQATQAASPTPILAPTATHALRTDFVATDPTTVKLAAGKPQLIEFFAYD